MEIPALLLAFLILCVEGRGNEKRQTGPVCLQCLKYAEAHDCQTVTTCEADEECFTEQYITQEGHIFFDLGCKSKQICDAINKYGKRSLGQPQRRQSDGRITLCEECCTGESCNGKGCDSYKANLPPASEFCTGLIGKDSTKRICYTCSGEQSVENPNDCATVTMCGTHEQCYQAYGLTSELEARYAMGCISDRACNVMYTSGGPSLGHPSALSRPGRDVSEIYERNHLKRDMGDISSKRQVRPDGSPMFTLTSCEYCCTDNYCNKHECVNGFVRTAPTTIHTTTHAPTTPKTTQAPATIHHTNAPTTSAPIIARTTLKPTTHAPITPAPTPAPTTPKPTTHAPITPAPTPAPTTQKPTTHAPITPAPTPAPTTQKPTTHAPITPAPTPAPTTQKPTTHAPITPAPTPAPTTQKPTTHAPITPAPTPAPTTQKPTTQSPTTKPTTPAHLTCLECSYSSHEIECNHTSVCNSGEICFLGRLDATDLNNNYCFYTTGCMQKTECDGYQKQQTSQGKVSVYGDNYEYFECCASSLCNEHTVRPAPAHCKPVPQVTTPKH